MVQTHGWGVPRSIAPMPPCPCRHVHAVTADRTRPPSSGHAMAPCGLPARRGP
ncbi:hypothetical protein STRIP9103_08803 [Streptomyces ipomoeae 91-03]|uniref:Uncharacterized protein n=1 Tax=Streptomyces ipomoeae 91-03 TaxID=698759 RepID=L1KSI3_9ACTN|nr:hypothetical protein STRIP9103_08803 [Streptomyces ipomoeae 91-03]